MSPNNINVQALANRFQAFNQQLITFVTHCAAADWGKITIAEGWSVGVTAHHVAATHYPLVAWVQLLVEGRELPPVTMPMVDEMNRQHAAAHADCTPAEVIELLQRDSAKALAYLLTLTDADLDRQGYFPVFETNLTAGQLFAALFLDYAYAHLESMRATVYGEVMAPEAVKALLYRLNDEIMNGGKLTVADEIFAPNYRHWQDGEVLSGPDAIKQMATGLRSDFPDLQITVNYLIAEGEMATSNWTCTGTYQGQPDENLKPGQKVTWSGASWFRVRGGKVCERWGYGGEMAVVEV